MLSFYHERKICMNTCYLDFKYDHQWANQTTWLIIINYLNGKISKPESHTKICYIWDWRIMRLWLSLWNESATKEYMCKTLSSTKENTSLLNTVWCLYCKRIHALQANSQWLRRSSRKSCDGCLQIPQKVDKDKLKQRPNKYKVDKRQREACQLAIKCFVFEPWAASLGSTVHRKAIDSDINDQTLGGLGFIGLQHEEFCSTFNILTAKFSGLTFLFKTHVIEEKKP